MKSSIVQGRARWAKILGAPVPGYDPESKEWSIDLILDEEGRKAFLASGADKFYIKEKDGEDVVRFVRKAKKKDGSEGKPISVIGPNGADWDQDVPIGNDSVINVKYTLNEVTSQGKKRLKPSIIAIQVWEHRPYTKGAGFPTKENSNVLEGASQDW